MCASRRKRAKLHFSGDRSWRCTSRAKRLQVESELPGDWPTTFSLLVKCDRVNGNPGLLSSQSRWRTGPIAQDTGLVLLGKNRTAPCREATFTEKYLDQWRHLSMKKKKTKTKTKPKLRIWTRGTSTAFIFRSWLSWSDWVWCQAQQRDGFWSPDGSPTSPVPTTYRLNGLLAREGFLWLGPPTTGVLRGPKLTLLDGAWEKRSPRFLRYLALVGKTGAVRMERGEGVLCWARAFEHTAIEAKGFRATRLWVRGSREMVSLSETSVEKT